MKFNIEKWARYLEQMGKEMKQTGEEIAQTAQMVNSDTDIRIFIDSNKSMNGFI